MNGIRFVHTDHWRLAGCVRGLAAAPDWLRRLARDATRGAVARVLEIAATQHAEFVLVAGRCSDSDEYDTSVAHWLQEPIESLKRRGIRVVMVADQPSATDALADVVVRAGECLHVSRTAGRTELSVHASQSRTRSDLVISPAALGASETAACNYLFQPAVRQTVWSSESRSPVYSAGTPQAHGPDEEGESGCLIVDADPGTGDVNVHFEETDPLRFETRRIDDTPMVTSQDICDAVVNESLELARQQRRTTVVDWSVESPVDCAGRIESWYQESILESVRSTLQKGHLGVWPRRVVVSPSRVRLTDVSDSEGARELTSLLFQQPAESREELNTAFAELITGTRLLSRAA